jgi:hypothetical protein
VGRNQLSCRTVTRHTARRRSASAGAPGARLGCVGHTGAVMAGPLCGADSARGRLSDDATPSRPAWGHPPGPGLRCLWPVQSGPPRSDMRPTPPRHTVCCVGSPAATVLPRAVGFETKMALFVTNFVMITESRLLGAALACSAIRYDDNYDPKLLRRRGQHGKGLGIRGDLGGSRSPILWR